MQRITISLDPELLHGVDARCRRRGYASRSEAIRDIIRDAAHREERSAGRDDACFAALSYVYDHETRELARRLTESQHHHHDLSVATLHVHVNERECLEVAILKGSLDAVRKFSDGITTQRGVRFGHLNVVPDDRRETHSPQAGDDGASTRLRRE